MVKISSSPSSQEFLKSIEEKKNIPLEEQLEKELRVSKNFSISEIQRNLGRVFGESAEDMERETVQSLMDNITNRVNQTLHNVSDRMQNTAPSQLSREVWRVGGRNIADQIAHQNFSGLNSLELGSSYLEHLDRAKKHAQMEWEVADERNRRFMEEKTKVKPFLGLWEKAETMTAKADFLQHPFTQKAGLLGLGGAGIFWGAGLGKYLISNFSFHGLEKAAAGVIAGFTAGSLPGAIIGGGIGITAGVLLPKAIASIQKKHAAKRKEQMEDRYNKFSSAFQAELERKFEEYDRIAKKIKESGEEQTSLRKDYIDAIIDSAPDTEKANLVGQLLSVKNDPSRDNINAAAQAFSLSQSPDEQFRITFLEAIKKLDWLDSTQSVATQLEHRSGQARTFRESAIAQEHEFLKQLDSTHTLFINKFRSFEDVQNYEHNGKRAFEFLRPTGKEVKNEDLIQAILFDLQRAEKTDTVSRKIKEEITTRSAGLMPATRLIMMLDLVFSSGLITDQNIITPQTKQNILDWIHNKDIASKSFVSSVSSQHEKYFKSFDKKGEFGALGEEILNFDFKKSGDEKKILQDIEKTLSAFPEKIEEIDDDRSLSQDQKDQIKKHYSVFESLLKQFQKDLKTEISQGHISFSPGSSISNIKKSIKNFLKDNNFSDIRSESTTLEDISRHGRLNKRIRETLFREFQSEMEEKIIQNWKENDPFELLIGLSQKAGRLNVGFIDNAEAMDELSFPSDLSKRQESLFTITSNSNEKGIELEGEVNGKRLRIHLLSPIIGGEGGDSITRNARIYDISSGAPDQAREAILTDARFSL